MSGYNDDGSYFRTKFDSARDEYLYTMWLDGWAEASDGESEAPTGFFCMMSNTEKELPEIHDAFGWLYPTKDLPDSNALIGNFLIVTDDHGMVWVLSYESRAELEKAYNDSVDNYCEWASQDMFE